MNYVDRKLVYFSWLAIVFTAAFAIMKISEFGKILFFYTINIEINTAPKFRVEEDFMGLNYMIIEKDDLNYD